MHQEVRLRMRQTFTESVDKSRQLMMGEMNNRPMTELFTAVRFKALDYAFEASTTLKTTMNLLAMPTLSWTLTGTGDLYPHTLPDDTYRRPWVRGKVISSCRLFVGGSALSELREKNLPVNSLERFSVLDDVDVISSSNPDSLEDSDPDRFGCLLNEVPNPCQEFFFKLTPDQMKPEDRVKDFFLPGELIVTDYLPQLKRHLPTLRAKLSRLKVLPVADPLRGSTGLAISKDSMFRLMLDCSCFRRCTSFNKPPDVDTVNHQTCPDVQEEFVKEPLLEEELLLLPAVVDTLQLKPQNFTAFSNIGGFMKVSPEPLDELRSVWEVLHKTVPSKSSVDICRYDVPPDHEKESELNRSLIESEFSDDFVLHEELELDLVLSPERSSKPICLSTSHLQGEELSPFVALSLVSAWTQKEMEATLWKAEKHLTTMVGFLLSEPRLNKTAVDFQPLHEALKVTKLEKEDFSRADDEQKSGILQVPYGHCCDFTEKMIPDIPTTLEEEMKVFTKLLPEDLEVGSVILDSPNKETCVDSSQSSFLMQAVVSNIKEDKPAAIASMKEEISKRKISEAVVGSSAQTNQINPAEAEQSVHSSEMNLSSRLNVKDDLKTLMFTRHQPEGDLDPLLDFIKLRSQQAPPPSPSSANNEVTETRQQTPQREQQPPRPEETWTPDRRPAYTSIAASGDASREQKPAAQRTNQFNGRPVRQPNSQEKLYTRVLQVQATDSQRRAYCELLAFARPCLSSARQTGLNLPSWGDFSCLAPDQTHFLFKQQESALCRALAESAELVKHQELLFNQAALIHVLVISKELLLKCDLSTAVESLTKAAEACPEQSLKQLLKRLQIILFLSQEKQELSFKLLELQQLLADWLDSREGNTATERILLILSVESDENRSMIISTLSQVTGAAVTAVCPEEDKKQLNGAGVVSSVCDTDCVVVFERHIGPDFPWRCFSLVVEFDHPGSSPWFTVCGERSISHLTFNTSVSETDALWCLEDNLPFVLMMTEGLPNCPLLLQTLESSFSVTVLERSHCPTLQMLGGIHNYTVITVDESTVVIIQAQDELCEERASERLVMRLTALSLQYSSCWLILHCPDSQGGGFSSEAFSNLVLVYSSLVLFNTKSGELDVKVLIVSEVYEMAKFINQICFTTLMSSDRDPVSYLNRDWLTVLPSQEEECLSKFPCINPLVGQLMLSRAPSLQWLLGAPLSRLKELLPEVPHKVLKTFTETTSLYWSNADPKHSETNQQTSLSRGPFAHTDEYECMTAPHPELMYSHYSTSFLNDAMSTKGPFSEQDSDSSDFRLDLNPSFGSLNVDLQRDRTRNDLWKEEEKLPFWSHVAGAAGRVVERPNNDWALRSSPSDYTSYIHTANSPLQQDFVFSLSPVLQQPASSQISPHPIIYSDLQNPQSDIIYSPPSDVLWGQSGNNGLSRSRAMTATSASFSPRCWKGQERKRSAEAESLFGLGDVPTPLKRGRLSYEKVPGRRDGQTRLKLF